MPPPPPPFVGPPPPSGPPLSLPVNTDKIDFDKYEEVPVETSGRDCPPPIMHFSEAPLGPELMANIQRAGFDKPTPVQKYGLPIVLNGRDLMACAQTGSGKTAAFLFPTIALMLRSGGGRRNSIYGRKTAPALLVLAPTRELANQIADEARRFTYGTSLKVCILYGGAPMGVQLRELERGCDILVATPGRLNDVLERGRCTLSQIRWLILDEADRMLDMGFEPQIRRIVEKEDMPRTGHRQTLMFSATFPKEIQRLAASFLYDYVFLAVGRVGAATELVTQKFVRVERDKESALLQLLRETKGLTLVFTETKRECSSLAHYLYRQGYPATSIHGDRTQAEREHALKSFATGHTPILVATNVAARGLDVDNIMHVINYDLPNEVDEYVHRIGRTGRAGHHGLATSLVTRNDTKILTKLLELLHDAHQEVPPWLAEMAPMGFEFKSGRRGGGGARFGGRDFRRKEQGYSFHAPAPLPPASSGGYGGYQMNQAGYPVVSSAQSYQPPQQADANTWAAYAAAAGPYAAR